MSTPPDPWDLSEVDAHTIQQFTHQPLGWQDIPWAEHLSHHWHNRWVSFPIVLAVVLVVISGRYGRQPAFHSLLRGLWLALLGTGWLAVALGEWQYRHFDAGQWSNVAQVHRWGGYFSLSLGTLAYGVWGRRQTWPAQHLAYGRWWWGFVSWCALLFGVGLLGGLLSSAH